MAHGTLEITRLLREARRRHLRVVLLAAGAGGLAAALAPLLAAAALVARGARLGPARAVAWTLAAAALLGAAAWALRAALRGARTPEAVARAVAAGQPALRSDLVSAVELSGEREALAASGAASLELLDAHVARTAEAAARIDLAAALPDRPARLAGRALAAVAALGALALLLGGRPVVLAARRVVAGDPSGPARPSLDPVTGDVEVTYRYPAHTRRPPRTLSGTGGELRAPRGTEVTLRTRADRPVEAAELVIEGAEEPGGGSGGRAGGAEGAGPGAGFTRRVALSVAGGRELTGTFVLDAGTSYHFRLLGPRGRLLAEGPPLPLVIEPDAFPRVSITAPQGEVEVVADAMVHVAWQAEDDYGLSGLELVTRGPGGAERRRPIRVLPDLARDSGELDLPVAAEGLAEGERLLYWLEVADNDAVSGPKRAASATQVIKIYSEAEHRRAAMERARAAWEELVVHLADRLEAAEGGSFATAERLPRAVELDQRTAGLVQRLREAAAVVRRERAAPRPVATALANVATQVEQAAQRAVPLRSSVRSVLARKAAPDRLLVGQLDAADRALEGTLERGVLYLEQLFDKARAEELVELARSLAAQRRELASLLERYRDAPTEQAKEAVLAQIRRMKERMEGLLARMAEGARGFHDEHMNAEALAELASQQDAAGRLDAAEAALRKGDVAAALKALDDLSARLDKMVAGLERTAGRPDERQRELAREMGAFKERLDKVQAEQERLAAETARLRDEARRRLAPRLEQARGAAERLRKEAAEARRELEAARPGVPDRGEFDLDQAVEGTADLERALAARDLEAARDTVHRALSPAQRLAMMAEEDARQPLPFDAPVSPGPLELAGAQGQLRRAVPRLQQIGAELQRLVPDPAEGLGPGDGAKLAEQARRQAALEQEAGDLQRRLAELSAKAPVFPPEAQQLLGESRGRMGEAAGELGARRPQRGVGAQQAALDALGRFRKGLEEMGGRSGGSGGFPYPFAPQGAGGGEGDGQAPTPEKVEIPGMQAQRGAEQFRRDLLEAMKQGAPERYRGEVQRYYQELVK